MTFAGSIVGDFLMSGIPFELNVIYTVPEVAKILKMHEQTVRSLCKSGRLRAQLARGGYRITGWQIRDYAENRCTLNDCSAALVK